VASVFMNRRKLTEQKVRTGVVSVITGTIEFDSRGDADVINLTAEVEEAVRDTGLTDGTATLFVPGATGALTTLEFERGVVHDFRALLDTIAPEQGQYAHNANLGDGNGHSHVRAGLVGPSLAIPFVDGRLTLGRWQSVVFCDFDARPRSRRLIVQVMGV
jgi:secondary thiamine-phosphate synthase enzyme